MIVLNYPFLLTSRNLQAFLRVIREGESWNDRDDNERDELAFRVRYHPTKFPTLFDSFDQHPRIFEPLPDGSGRRSSAAGAFQIIVSTWDDICRNYEGIGPTFKPYDQMCAAVALFHRRNALEDIVDGKFAQALQKCAPVWASLPDSPLRDGGTKMTYAHARAVYVTWGGSFFEDVYVIKPEQTQPPAPIEDRSVPARQEDIDRITEQEAPSMGPLAFILPLLQSLFNVFEPLAKAKLNDALNKQVKDPVMSQQLATELMNIVKQAAGVTGGVSPAATSQDPAVRQAEEIAQAAQAVQVVKTNATMVQQVEADMLNYLDRIAPMIDRIDQMEQRAWSASESSMMAAAQRAASTQNDDWMARSLVGGILAVSGILILFVGGVAITQIAMLPSRTPTTEVWAAITGIIGTVLGTLGTVYAYRFGTSRSSVAKDVTISELSNTKVRR